MTTFALKTKEKRRFDSRFTPIAIAVAAAGAVMFSVPVQAAGGTVWEHTFNLSTVQTEIDKILSADSTDHPNTLYKGIIAEDSRSNQTLTDAHFGVFWNNSQGSVSQQNGSVNRNNHTSITFTGDLNLNYNLIEQGSTVSTALNFFQPNWLTKGGEFRGIHRFKFEGDIGITILDASITVTTMKAEGQDNPGLLVTNKKKIVEFDQRANLQVGYHAHLQNVPDNQKNNLLVLAGIYTTFGAVESFTYHDAVKAQFGLAGTYDATDYDESYYTTLKSSAGAEMGTTRFHDGLNLVMVNSENKTDAEIQAANDTAKNRAAFGIFLNEGGTLSIESREGSSSTSNLILIGSQGSTQIAAVNLSARAGIMDPLKQGTFTFTAGGGQKNRIWSFSSDLIAGEPITPGGNEADAGKHEMHLRDALQSFHGANASVADTAASWLDIRGDVLAGVKNESPDIFAPANSNLSKMQRVVNFASASITLENEKSRLFGNIYERHRLGKDEVPAYSDSAALSSPASATFAWWRKWAAAEESKHLGGEVNLTVANGATWFPIICELDEATASKTNVPHGWNGWDYTAVTSTADMTGEQAYNAVINKSDQYNLYWKDSSGTTYTLNEASPLTTDGGTVLNDYDLVAKTTENDTNVNKQTLTAGIPYVDRTNAKINEAQVDNGIFRLALNNGVVDTRFMRRDFHKLVYVQEADDIDALTLAVEDDPTRMTGIRKLRIQQLDGTGGTFNIFVKDKSSHDVVIIDETTGGTAENALSIWNNIDDASLGINRDDPTTFVHVARAGHDVSFKDSFQKKAVGSAWMTEYTVKKDEGDAWANAQNALLTVVDGKTPDGAILSHASQNNWFITDWKTLADPVYEETAVNAFSMPYLYATQMERLQKRMGEARYAIGEEDGAWVRLHTGRSDRDFFEDKNNMVQIGWDRRSHHDDAAAIHGVAFDYLHSDADWTDALYGKSEMDRYRLTLYSTWFGNDGWYVDAVGRVAWHDTDLKGANANADALDTSFDMWGAAASLETGWKLANEEKWYMEPQVQLQYTYLGSSHYETRENVRIDNAHVESLIGRAGIRLGRDLERLGETGTEKMNLYFRADVLHEFKGDQKFTIQGTNDRVPVRYTYAEDTWYDVGAGMTYRAADDYYFFVDVERPFGSGIGSSWELNAGFHWLF